MTVRDQDDEASQLATLEAMAAELGPDVVPQLIRAMGSKSWRVRQGAIAALAHRGGIEVVSAVLNAMRAGHRDFGVLNSAIHVLTQSGADTQAALRQFLTGPDSELGAYAAIVLGDQGSTQAAPDLLAALNHPDLNLRYHAIEALGKLRSATAVEALITIVESRDFSLAFPALTSLALIGDCRVAHRLVPLLEDDLLQTATIEALGQLGDEEAVEPLTALLARSDSPVGAIARSLASLHSRYELAYRKGDYIADLIRRMLPAAGVRNLFDAISRSNDGERKALTFVLGWLEEPEVEATLAGLIKDPVARDEAVEALVRRGKKVIELLIGHLDAEDVTIRRAVATALGRIGDSRAVPALLAALQADQSSAVAVAGALTMIGDARAYRPLIELLGHPNAGIRQAVISALDALGHPDMAADLLALHRDPDPFVRESAARIAGYFGFPGCADLLSELCKDERENVRRAAIESLPHVESPRVLPTLIEALRDGSPKVRAAAARGLGQVDSPDARPGLQDALHDSDPWVRYFAARSAGRHGDATAIATLRTLRRDDHAMQVRIAAVSAIGVLGGLENVALLASLAEGADDDLAGAALAALGSLSRFDNALPPLIAAAATPRRLHAINALAKSGRSEATATLRQVVSEGDPAAARAAVQALGQLATPEAIDALVELTAAPHWRDASIAALAGVGENQISRIGVGLGHPDLDVRRSVVAALARMMHPSAADCLRNAMNDPEAAVRQAAITALAHSGNVAATGS